MLDTRLDYIYYRLYILYIDTCIYNLYMITIVNRTVFIYTAQGGHVGPRPRPLGLLGCFGHGTRTLPGCAAEPLRGGNGGGRGSVLGIYNYWYNCINWGLPTAC